MTCPAIERLAAAVAGEDAAAALHAASCVPCRRVAEEQREIVALARRAAGPELTAARRTQLAAEVMARADHAVGSWPRRPWRLVVGCTALAAAAVASLVLRASGEPRSPELAIATVEPSGDPELVAVAHLTAPAHAEAPAVVRAPELVRLTDGELSVDASEQAPVTVLAGDTRVIVRAKARVVARAGVIVTAHVFAGSAEIERGGRRQVIEAGDVWTRPEIRDEDSLGAFRTGWEALRAQHYATAIAAFDRATDEVVAEDAAFWAAIASERAGEREDAARRLRRFLATYPASPRADAARAALERVTR